jgi:hypothetical protein
VNMRSSYLYIVMKMYPLIVRCNLEVMISQSTGFPYIVCKCAVFLSGIRMKSCLWIVRCNLGKYMSVNECEEFPSVISNDNLSIVCERQL